MTQRIRQIETCSRCIVGTSALLGLCFCHPVYAAETPAPEPKLLSDPSLIKPEGVASQGQETVQVLVSVSKSGDVTEVVILDGPAALHEAARRVALQLRFKPAVVDGVVVPSQATLPVYLEPSDGRNHDHWSSDELVIQATGDDRHDSHSRTVLDSEALERSTGQTLAEAVSRVPGVQLARTSGTSAKPIIRGYSERRLLVLHDGVRHESQKWGPDHAPEIDTFSAGSITVIKGPAGARYGPDALGGVLLIEPPPMRAAPGVGGKAMVLGATNGRRAYTALRVDAVSPKRPTVTYRMEGSFNDSASLSAPEYILGNTAAREWSGGGAVEWRAPSATIRLRYHHFDRRGGIFYGISHSTPAEFQAQYEAGTPVTAEAWKIDRVIDRPSQDVTHDRVTLHADGTMDSGWSWEAIYAYQHNRREEYAQIRKAVVSGPQYDFTLRTHSLDLSTNGPGLVFGARRFTPDFGVQGGFQENVYRGYSLIPNHRSFTGGAFAHGRFVGDHGAVTVATRLDHMSRVAFIQEDDFDRHIARDTLTPADCPDYENGEACPLHLNTGSVSLGGVWHTLDSLDLKLDLSRASRFPNTDELYLIGAAPSLPVFAIGDPGLGVETTWGLSPTAVLSTRFVNAEIGGFANRVQDYIYFAPALSDSGEPKYNVTIEGAWPEYAVRPIDAHFVGTDGFVDLAPEAVVGLRTQGSVVRATDAASGNQLVGTPPDRISSTVYLRPPTPRSIHAWTLSAEAERIAKQSRVDPSTDILEAPEGATLLHAEASFELDLARQDLRFAVRGSNLTNVTYRDYTSLLRYYADQPGRDIRVRMSADF